MRGAGTGRLEPTHHADCAAAAGYGGRDSVASSSAAAPAPAATPAAAQPKRGGTLRAGLVGDVGVISPHTIGPQPLQTIFSIWDRLIAYNAAGKPQPMLAESWDLSSDQTKLRFQLLKIVCNGCGPMVCGLITPTSPTSPARRVPPAFGLGSHRRGRWGALAPLLSPRWSQPARRRLRSRAWWVGSRRQVPAPRTR